MSFFKNNRLAIRLAKISVFIAFVLGLILSSIQVYLDYQEQDKSLEQMVAKILSVAERPASTSVHLLSKDLAGEVVSGLMEYDFIEKASISDDLDLLLAERRRSESSDIQISRIAQIFSVEHKRFSINLYAPSVNKETPGELTVYVNVNVVFSSFYDRAILIFFTGIIRNVILTFLLFFSFFYIITKPLSEISKEFSKRIPGKSSNTDIAMPKGHINDELSLLVDSINNFFYIGRKHILELEAKNEALSEAKNIWMVSEKKYKNLYQYSDVSIWEEDFSMLLEELQKLKNEGVIDIEAYLKENVEHLIDMSKMVKVIGINDATLEMFEANSEQDFINSISAVFDPDTSLKVFSEEVVAIWNKDKYFRREVKQLTLKGKLITTILSLPIPKSIEDSKQVPVTLIDTTSLSVAQHQIRKLSLAIEHNPSAVFITDLNGIIEYANPKVAQITGYEIDTLLGSNIVNLRNYSQNAFSQKQIIAQLIQGEEWRCEVTASKQNGETYWIREFMAAIKNESDEVTHFVTIYEDINEEKLIFEKISYRATHDNLTKLINRDEFERRLERVVSSAQKEDGNHILCFLDLDQFKVINDTSGHIAGDELLKQISNLLKDKIRKRDTVARIGGDEFAILMEHCQLSQAMESMENIREQIESFQFEWQKNKYRMTISIGVATIDRNTENTVELLKQADLACYVAKERGRNHVHVYDITNEQISQREGEMYLVSEISKALEQNLFQLYAQPIIPLLDSSAYVGFEVLVRMKGSSGQLIPPGKFLPSAERYGLSAAIDKWVINNTFSWVSKNINQLSKIHHFAINLSGKSLGDRSVLKCIFEQFKKTKLRADFFTFEITETAAIDNLLEAKEFINSIRSFGCSVALDDFGSGLSSFAYLKNLPIDYLKIDGMFVKEIASNSIDEAMVRSINEIGHVMGIKTIGEFVENENIRKKLISLGVDYGQGYGLGKPEPIENILRSSKK